MNNGFVLYHPQSEDVITAHENFGITVRGLVGPHLVGEILTVQVQYHRDPSRALAESEPVGLWNYKILRQTNVAEVRALLQRIGCGHKPLKRGLYWYEVHGD